ncbi:MAG: iron-containing alcohol dehydrogenase [Prevotella sp.]|uniref:iron-containing alcohol dehydrogenase n=1 Tax=Prevotella sp. TaxID=59823 RepID=UPI002A25FF37|nr:iron-containing alcohol dehydrogenase [Prevotella sp.]MDD7319186.1 iron-containing alcohol dehydrogenase [Prevotellaceae bacterium]MDY4020054.1 iron-containing alcohol dehydrogenase [Prevotella sp.]
MEGNFSYYNPTKLYFGEDALKYLSDELKQYGPVVQLCYGGGSIKRNGIYDAVVNALKEVDKTIVEDAGVMPNPTVEKLYEGARIARENNVDLILAVGGGSTIDYAKGVSCSAWCESDPWQKYYVEQQEADCRVIPIGAVLTMVGTGSEMNGGSVITNRKVGMKIGKVFGSYAFPKFTVLNPKFTFTVPQYQMVAGFFDIMSHIMEQYFQGEGDYTTDYIAEGLMRSLVHSSRIAVKNPQDYEARSNIMWTATWALNTLLKSGKGGDWMVHMIGQAIGAHTDATHGMTLAAVSIPYYKYVSQFGLKKFARFATAVWGIVADGKTDRELADAGIAALESWMKEIGVVMHSAELGVTNQNISAIADSTIIFDAGYHKLTREEVIEILKESL